MAIRVQRCSLLSPTMIEIYKELERDYEFITLIHKWNCNRQEFVNGDRSLVGVLGGAGMRLF